MKNPWLAGVIGFIFLWAMVAGMIRIQDDDWSSFGESLKITLIVVVVLPMVVAVLGATVALVLWIAT